MNVELEGVRSCVRASETKQAELLAELQQKHSEYFGKSGGSKGAASGELTRLTAAADEFRSLGSDVIEGMKFYAELTESCLRDNDDVSLVDHVFRWSEPNVRHVFHLAQYHIKYSANTLPSEASFLPLLGQSLFILYCGKDECSPEFIDSIF